MQQRLLKAGKTVFPVIVGVYEESGAKFPQLQLHFKPKGTYDRARQEWIPDPDWVRLKDEIKSMAGSKFREIGKKKTPEYKAFWTIYSNQRNHFTLDYMDTLKPNPYARWTDPFPIYNVIKERYGKPLREFQIQDASEIIHKHVMMVAAEPGAGKTLIAITALDYIKTQITGEVWYVGPAFALGGIKRQFLPRSEANPDGWNCSVWPRFFSYNAAVKELKNWDGRKAPQVVILDESVNVKTALGNATSDYIQALTDGMREDWEDPYIIEMSGVPAPKDPTDFWKQLEILRPGFIKEGDIYRFQRRLGLWKTEEGAAGGTYPKRVTWFDDDKKCKVCGQFEDAEDHEGLAVHFHSFEPSINEVDRLYKSMTGIIRIRLKKDILPELPDKIERFIDLEADAATKRRLSLILKGSKRTIEALELAREISDGIRYEYIDSDTLFQPCERCDATLEMIEYVGEEAIRVPCTRCDHGDGPTGQQKRKVQNTIYIPTPKDAALVELLKENEETGRIVIYAGYTASINRIIAVCKKEGWHTIRADGATSSMKYKSAPSWNTTEDPQMEFQHGKLDKIAFIAHPKTAKAGITLTKACMIVYYSLTFNGDDWMQSQERIHRQGMDLNKGATLVYLFHLWTDRYMFENLKNKRKLQSISLGELQRAFDTQSNATTGG